MNQGMREYWKGYRRMKQLAYYCGSPEKRFQEIYQSNASDKYVAGARRALEYIRRVGVANITV